MSLLFKKTNLLDYQKIKIKLKRIKQTPGRTPEGHSLRYLLMNFLIIRWITVKNSCNVYQNRIPRSNRMTYLMHAGSTSIAIKGFVWNVLQPVMFLYFWGLSCLSPPPRTGCPSVKHMFLITHLLRIPIMAISMRMRRRKEYTNSNFLHTFSLHHENLDKESCVTLYTHRWRRVVQIDAIEQRGH